MKVAVTGLIVCVTGLLALGLVMLYSSSMTMPLVDKQTNTTHPAGAFYLLGQLRWCLVGAVACAAAASMDTRIFKKYAWVLYAALLVLAALVFVPHLGVGKMNGAHRWLRAPGGQIQPSEFLKVGLVLMLAWYGDYFQRRMERFRVGALMPLAIAAVALGLIFIEPDRGTTILLGGVTFIMLTVAGTRLWYLLAAALVGAGLLAYSLSHDQMRMGRIAAWQHPETDHSGKSDQGEMAKLALGRGGKFGMGLGNGIEKHGYLSEIHSDFIFANIGEELGLVATLPVLLAYGVIVVCGWSIARRARDQFSCLLALGISSLIGLEAFINIGVVTTLLPNKGLALPFISAGGSNLVAMLSGVGLLLAVARQGEAEVISASDVPGEPAPAKNPFAAGPAPAA